MAKIRIIKKNCFFSFSNNTKFAKTLTAKHNFFLCSPNEGMPGKGPEYPENPEKLTIF